MNKQKITLPQKKWGTLKSKYKPESNDVLPDEFTAGSVNFVTNQTGSIEKMPTDVLYNSAAFATNCKDQFEAIFSSGVHHLLVMDGGLLKYSTGNRSFTTVASGFTVSASMEYSMYQNRVYMDNGIDVASVYDITASYGGVSYSVPQVKTMGCQAPGSAPTFNADSAGGSVPLGGHRYKVTFMYYGEEESNGGIASALHTISDPNYTVNLTAIPVGGYGVTSRKIYRDNNDGNFLLVGTLSNNTVTTFVDNASTGTTAIPTSNDVPPVFSYITLNLSRNWVAGVPGTPSVIYWSTPDFPDIFDPNNFIICNPKDPITGVCTFQGLTLVLNRHSFGKILGTSDDTFYYDEIPGTVGCVDNRSIQIRTIDGVPVLVWLSDRGFYKFDGSSVTYISDPIEDLVNFNLQQVSFTTGSNNQSTEADYAAGTSSPSIDIASNPGTITVLNPKKTFQSESDWEGGASLTNIKTADGTNQLKVPTRFAPTLASGALGGSASISGSSLVLSTQAPFTGESVGNPGDYASMTGPGGGIVPTGIQGFAYSFTPARSGTLTNLSFNFGSTNVVNYTVMVWSDAFNSPGVALYTGSAHTAVIGTPNVNAVNETVSIPLIAGTTYWFGLLTTQNVAQHALTFKPANFSGGTFKQYSATALGWSVYPLTNFGTPANTDTVAYTFSQTPISASGTWQSPVFDSGSLGSAVSDVVVNTGSFPANCSGTIFVDMSNDATLSTGVTTYSQADPNGSYSPSLTGNRYWRLRYSISTTNNLTTPSVTAPTLKFSTTGTWISQPIDCTTDVTAYSGLAVTQNVPVGSSVAVTVATSADNITYSSYGPIGSAAVFQYIKIKVVLTTTSDNVSTPSVSFLNLTWTQTSTFTSSIIDVGQIPTGWGVFQNSSLTNGGTLTFYMRSAASSGAISAAAFHVVSNGVFPPASVSPLEYTQWKIVFTSLADSLPEVSGVTVNWFIGTAQSPIRAASLFFNKTYYLSAATTGSTTNNIVLAWDFENNWRVFTGVTISSLGLFFNEPFYCDAVRTNVYQWLAPATGLGVPIMMDVRTKAFDLGNVSILKNVRSLRVTGINTGTTLHAYYSVDRGTTWIEMLNTSGTTGYMTTTSGSKFSQYFVADYSGLVAVSGTTVMYRITSTDAYPAVIMELEPTLYSRSGNYLGMPL